MTHEAAKIAVGTEGVKFLPFGNGAERMFNNKQIGASIHGLDFNRHSAAHLFRATQEGIVFALNYGLSIMKNVGVKVETVKAGRANLFLSPLFREAFANTTGATIELFDTDGATGAARGAGIGCGYYKNASEAFIGLEKINTIEPNAALQGAYTEGYENWLAVLNEQLNK
jgi:xylulokinase